MLGRHQGISNQLKNQNSSETTNTVCSTEMKYMLMKYRGWRLDNHALFLQCVCMYGMSSYLQPGIRINFLFVKVETQGQIKVSKLEK